MNDSQRGDLHHQDNFPQSTWATRLLNLGTAAWIAVPISLLAVVARSDDIGKLFSYGGNDMAWCPYPDQFLGRHCFSDHGIIPLYTYSGDVWGGLTPAPTPTPAGSMGFHWLMFEAGRLLGWDFAGTLLVIFAAGACLLVPYFWSVQAASWRFRAQAFLLTGLGSYPILINLDRAQITGLLILPLFLATLAYFRDKYTTAAIWIGLAATFKPQLILIAVIFVAARSLRPLFLSAGTMILGITVSFLLFPGDRIHNASTWVRNMISYSDYGGGALDWGLIQLSTRRSVEFIWSLFHLGTNSETAISPNPIYLGLGILTTTVIFLGLTGTRSPKFLTLILALTLPILVPGTTFIYYSAIWLIPLALVLRDPLLPVVKRESGVLDDRKVLEGFPLAYVYLLFAFLLLTMVPLAAPLSYILSDPSAVRAGLLPTLAGPATLLLWFASVGLLIPKLFQRPILVEATGKSYG